MRTLILPLALALAVAWVAGAAPARSPRLASLQIEIWPEYDRPQSLVILKGELAAGVTLPATVALRIPASAGQPSAVAYVDEAGRLLNLDYQRQDAGPFILVRLTTPQRGFHLEFYDALVMREAQREYRYAWPGDLAVDKISVLVKEPAAASELSVSPPLAIAGASPDGLKYHAGDLGALKAGEPMVVALRYAKGDPRSTTEILASSKAVNSAAPAASRPTWPLALIAAGMLLAGSVLFVLWWRRGAPGTARACRKCARPAAGGDRFCAGCGAALK